MKRAREEDMELPQMPSGDELVQMLGDDELPPLVQDDFFQQFPGEFNPNEFYGNLVPIIKQSNGESYLQSLANSIATKIEDDEKTMQKWQQNTTKCLQLLGSDLTEIPTDSTSVPQLFDGTFNQTALSTAIHITDEILKPDGCVSVSPMHVNADNMVYDAADQFKNDMDNYLIQDEKGFYPNIRQGIVWMVLTGNIFRKVYVDEMTGLPTDRYMPKLIINSACSSIDEAERITEEITFTRNQIIARMQNGFFVEEDILPTDDLKPDMVKEQVQRMDGRETTDVLNENKYKFYMSNIYLPLNVTEDGYDDYEASERDGKLDKIQYPYKVWIDKTTKLITRIERNWKPGDNLYKFLTKYFHWKFFTGYDFMGIGLAQLCGNNAQILNFALKQILDSALKANHPGFLMSNMLRNKESTFTINPSSITPVEGLLELGKSIMPVPTKEPSAMLYQLVNDIKDNIRGVGATVEQIGEFNPNIPVGTIIALIEQYMKMPNHIVRNIYNVFSNELTEIGKLCVETGIIPIDFGLFSQLKITSIANPHLSSNVQRSLQAEVLDGVLQAHPNISNEYEIVKFKLLSAQIINPEKYLNAPKQPAPPVPQDPINENIVATQGMDIIPALQQDHPSHIVCHEDRIAQEMMKPQPDFMLINKLQIHIAQHKYLQAVQEITQVIGQPIPEDPNMIAQNIEIQNMIAQAEAAPIMQQKQEQQQPMDPTAALIEQAKVEERIAEMRRDYETQIAQLKAQVELKKAELNFQEAQEKNKIEMMKLETQDQFSRDKLTTDTNVKMRQHYDKITQDSYKTGIDEIRRKYNIN